MPPGAWRHTLLLPFYQRAMKLEAVGIFLDVVVLFAATCFCRGSDLCRERMLLPRKSRPDTLHRASPMSLTTVEP
jgi:hypothetical protein